MKLSGAVELVRLANALDHKYNYFNWEYLCEDTGVKVIVNDHVFSFDVSSFGMADCVKLIGILDEIKDGAILTDWAFHDDNGIILDIDGVSYLFEMS